jgi:hypothetical protein
MEQNPIENLMVSMPAQEITNTYGTRRFTAVFTKVLQWFPSQT